MRMQYSHALRRSSDLVAHENGGGGEGVKFNNNKSGPRGEGSEINQLPTEGRQGTTTTATITITASITIQSLHALRQAFFDG